MRSSVEDPMEDVSEMGEYWGPNIGGGGESSIVQRYWEYICQF